MRVFLYMFFFYRLYLPVILSVPGGHFARAFTAKGLVVRLLLVGRSAWTMALSVALRGVGAELTETGDDLQDCVGSQGCSTKQVSDRSQCRQPSSIEVLILKEGCAQCQRFCPERAKAFTLP